MVRARASAILSLLLLVPCAATLSAEEASHQRLSVEGRENFDLLLGTAATLTSSDSSGNAGIEIDQTVSLDILFHRRFGISFELPAFAWAATERDAVPRAIGTLGDPNIAATYSFRVSDWRLGAGLSYTYPLGIWNEYEAAERRIASGSGYHKIGFACADDPSDWYPSGKASVVSYYESSDGSIKSCVATCKLENTGNSTISTYTISISATTDVRTYYQ